MMATSLRTAALAATAVVITTAYAPLSARAAGQTAAARAATESSPALVLGSFERLAPHQQRIVRALFNAQRPTAGGPAPLDLDQIAALGDRHGWRHAFKRLKEERLISAKNLRQVLIHYRRSAVYKRFSPRNGLRMIALTDGSGRTFTAMSDVGSVTGAGRP